MLDMIDTISDTTHLIAEQNGFSNTAEGGISATMRIATATGWKMAADIVAGDQVLTFDHGLKTVWSVQNKKLCAFRDNLPLLVPVGAIGNNREFLIPQQQVIMLESDYAEELYGCPFALIRASDLIGYNGISKIVPSETLDVVSLEFENDEVIYGANGCMLLCAKSQEAAFFSDVQPNAFEYEVLSSEMAATILFGSPVAATDSTSWEDSSAAHRADHDEVLSRTLCLVA